MHQGTCDIREPESIDAMLSAIQARFGKVDILVNNAGGPPPGDFRDWERTQWLAALEANMLSPIALIRATVDGMAQRGFGRVVNITSRMGSLDDNTSGGYYGYRMSYAAQNMATRSLAVDCKSRGVTVVGMQGKATVDDKRPLYAKQIEKTDDDIRLRG